MGICSDILLNSSPASLPDPRACANCLNAFDASMVDAPANLAAVLNPKNVLFISSTPTPKGASLAVISVIPSSASVALSPKAFCASAAICCDFAKVPDAFVSKPSLTFNFSKFAEVLTACFANKPIPIPAIAVLRPPKADCSFCVFA